MRARRRNARRRVGLVQQHAHLRALEERHGVLGMGGRDAVQHGTRVVESARLEVEHTELEVPDGLVIAVGGNGEGKTNLLEGMFFLFGFGSPRASVNMPLVREGADAQGAVSVMPSVTFPAHTTMITGVNPRRHGIRNNAVFDPDGRMIAQVPWVCLKNPLDKRINDAMDRLGTAASWPSSEPSGQCQRLTLVKASTPAEDRARRDEQARGHFFHSIAFMKP